MKRCFVVFATIVICCAGSTDAFDGDRKGFVLGGGLGFAPVSKWSTDFDLGGPETDESNSGGAAQLIIGYAWDEFNMIVYDVNVASVNSDGFDDNIGQGIGAASWYHYFGIPGKSFFSTAGLGYYDWINEPMEDFADIDPGFGIVLGGGYEFARHWQVGGYFSAGKTSWLGADFKHTNFTIIVSGVAF